MERCAPNPDFPSFISMCGREQHFTVFCQGCQLSRDSWNTVDDQVFAMLETTSQGQYSWCCPVDLHAHWDVAVIASLGSPTLAETKLRGPPESQQTHTLHPEGLSPIQTPNQKKKAAIKEKDHLQNAKGCFRRVQSEEKIERRTAPKTRQA